MKTIHVTQEDIEKGSPSYTCCPVAIAATRQTGKYVYVSSKTIDVWDNFRKKREITQPSSVAKFVRAFGAGEPVKPFSFKLDI